MCRYRPIRCYSYCCGPVDAPPVIKSMLQKPVCAACDGLFHTIYAHTGYLSEREQAEGAGNAMRQPAIQIAIGIQLPCSLAPYKMGRCVPAWQGSAGVFRH